MNFFKNVGEFYIDECCTAAGYDHMGRLVEGATPVTEESKSEQVQAPGPYDLPPLEPEKKKRTYNRSGKLKPNEQS
jgi:hypothetical protein